MKLSYNLDAIKDFNVSSGKQRAKLLKVEQSMSSRNKPMLVWTWRLVTGPDKGKEIRSYTSLVKNALGNMKNHLMAFKLHGKVSTDTHRLIGKYAILVISQKPSTQEGKEGTTFSAVNSILPDKPNFKGEEEFEDEDEEEEEYEDEEDEEESEDEEEDYEEEDSDEEEEPRKSKRSSSKRTRRSVDEDEEDDEESEDEEEDEDEEEQPKRRPVKRTLRKRKLPF